MSCEKLNETAVDYTTLGRPCAIAVATAWDREVTSSFEKMLSTWNRTVRSVTPMILAISQFVFPFFTQFRIVISRRESSLTQGATA